MTCLKGYYFLFFICLGESVIASVPLRSIDVFGLKSFFANVYCIVIFVSVHS